MPIMKPAEVSRVLTTSDCTTGPSLIFDVMLLSLC